MLLDKEGIELLHKIENRRKNFPTKIIALEDGKDFLKGTLFTEIGKGYTGGSDGYPTTIWKYKNKYNNEKKLESAFGIGVKTEKYIEPIITEMAEELTKNNFEDINLEQYYFRLQIYYIDVIINNIKYEIDIFYEYSLIEDGSFIFIKYKKEEDKSYINTTIISNTDEPLIEIYNIIKILEKNNYKDKNIVKIISNIKKTIEDTIKR